MTCKETVEKMLNKLHSFAERKVTHALLALLENALLVIVNRLMDMIIPKKMLHFIKMTTIKQ